MLIPFFFTMLARLPYTSYRFVYYSPMFIARILLMLYYLQSIILCRDEKTLTILQWRSSHTFQQQRQQSCSRCGTLHCRSLFSSSIHSHSSKASITATHHWWWWWWWWWRWSVIHATHHAVASVTAEASPLS